MALLFLDGFDHYGSSDISKKWTSAGNFNISTSGGRRSSGCLAASAYGAQASKTVGGTAVTVVAGFALKYVNTHGSYAAALTLREGTTQHLTLRENGSKLELRRGDMYGTSLGFSSLTLTSGVWYYVELKATINSTTGSAELRINGNVASGFSLSGINTRNGGTSGIVNVVDLGQGSNGGWFNYDDFYFCDVSGSTNNDFLGDCRIDTILPTGDGNYTQFTPSTGTSHYALVDENPPNTTDYNYSATAGNRDSYTFPTITSLVSQTIYGIQINAAALKSDAGASRSLGTMSRLSSTDKDGAGASLGTSLAYVSEIQETDPSSAAWTQSNVNSAQFGVKVTV